MATEEELQQVQRDAGGPSRQADPSSERQADDAREDETRQREGDTIAILNRLAGKPAAEVLARITDGDLLRLFPLCAQRIRDAAYMLDPERVFELALTKTAIGIELDGVRCSEPGWLIEFVDRAISSTLERDRADEQSGNPPDCPPTHFPLLIESCYVEPALARLASVRYNALEARVRLGFQKLIVEGLPLEQVLAMGLGPPDRLQVDILVALKAIGLLDDEGVEQFRSKEAQP